MSLKKLGSSSKLKSVLLVVPDYSSFKKPIIEELQNLKIHTAVFDNRKTTYLEKLFFVLSKIDSKFRVFANHNINERLMTTVRQFNPDLVLVVKGENLLLETIKNIASSTRIINWFPDYLHDHRFIIPLITHYSIFLHPDRYEVKQMQKAVKNILYLPFAAEIRSDLLRSKKIYPLVFVGSYSKERENFLLNLSDQPLFIWGDSAWKASKLSNHYQKKWLKREEMLKIFAKSKIVINLHRSKLTKSEATNLRTFEITGVGAFMLSDYRKSLEELFKIGDEIVCFKNAREMRQKVVLFLGNEKLRKQIAKRGFLRAKKDHNYKKRIKQMLSMIYRK